MFCSASVADNGTRMMAHIKLCKELNDDKREFNISGVRRNLVCSTNESEDDEMDVIELEDQTQLRTVLTKIHAQERSIQYKTY